MRTRLAVFILATVVSAACGDDTTGPLAALSLQKRPTGSAYADASGIASLTLTLVTAIGIKGETS